MYAQYGAGCGYTPIAKQIVMGLLGKGEVRNSILFHIYNYSEDVSEGVSVLKPALRGKGTIIQNYIVMHNTSFACLGLTTRLKELSKREAGH